jgi:hypothetical protein
MRQDVWAKIDFEEANPLDILGAIKATPIFDDYGLHVVKVSLEAEGEGVENLLSWAIADIYEAISYNEIGDEKNRKRKSTSSVINARRSLSCLVDWYMQRDGFKFCKDFNDSSEAKSGILLRTGIIDKLSSKVLKRLIDVRNEAEHKYASVAMEEAEDIVELLRRLYDSLMSFSRPNEMHVIWGKFPYGYEWKREGGYVFHFAGWDKACFVLQLTDINPWVGVVLPKSKEHAVVMRAFLRQMTVDTLFDILSYVKSAMDLKNKRWRSFDNDRAMPKNFYNELCKMSGLL